MICPILVCLLQMYYKLMSWGEKQYSVEDLFVVYVLCKMR